jgi:hypothetical protein
MMKELDSEISKSSSDVTQTLESKDDEADNEISTVGTTLVESIDKDKDDIKEFSKKSSDKKSIDSIQRTLTKEIVS